MKQFISAAANVNIGKQRGNNEDNLYFNGVFLTEETREQPAVFETLCGDSRQFYAVCDGMGGEQMGELASLIAVETLHKYAERLKDSAAKNEKNGKNIDTEVENCIRDANNLIFETQKERGFKRIGTTLALLIAENKRALWYNVGDSRIYLFRGGKLKQLSTDHTAVANMLKIGAITPEQAKTHPRRNSLTQYVGIDPAEMIIEADSSAAKMKNNDIFLLCSDGLTDMLDEPDIARILAGTNTPAEAARQLVNEALAREGKDNITAVVLTYSRKPRRI